ncbi:MAG: class I SAM-dependent methyltransferase [Myxococcales bacterium]|nr:class I SAM-dependent methyltransferase [Myxococcales bacterium]
MLRPLLLALLLAAPAAPTYTPQVGQSGKDVIWVPTPDELALRMLTMAQVGPHDLVIDLGSGDGRLPLLAASRFGAHALGVESNPELVALSRQRARAAGLSRERVRFEQGDLFKLDLRPATVITLYLLPALNRRLRPILLALRPGTRIVSHQFHMDDWIPDETSYVEQRAAFLWIVPAQVAGGWQLRGDDGLALDLDLEQEFQRIKGRAELPAGAGTLKAGLRDPILRGDLLRFELVDRAGHLLGFAGRVSGERMTGSVTGPAGTRTFTATRRPP